jgi:uncharacterized membrane protein YjjB (DUF3815 family)
MQEIIVSYLGAISVAIFFNTPPKKLFFVGFLGIIAWVGSHFFYTRFGNQTVSIFVASLAMGIASEWLAIYLKTPSIIFSISGCIPLVPGFSTYQAAKFSLEGNYSLVAYHSITAIVRSGAIALGIMLATGIFMGVKGYKKDKSRNQKFNVLEQKPTNIFLNIKERTVYGEWHEDSRNFM